MVESWKVSQFIKKYEDCSRICNNWPSFCSVCIQHIKILWKRFVKSWISAGISVHVYFWGIVSSPLQLAEVCSVSALIVVCIIDSNALHLNQLCWLFVCVSCSMLFDKDAGHKTYMEECYEMHSRLPGTSWGPATRPWTDVVGGVTVVTTASCTQALTLSCSCPYFL